MEQENLAFIVGGDTHLFHGTAVQGIDALKKGIEDTLGTGVYFTSDRKAAEGYARVRNGRGGHPTVYEAVAPDAKFVDLRDIPTLDAVMQGYLEFLPDWLERDYPEKETTNPNDKRSRRLWGKKIARITQVIQNKRYSPGTIRNVAYEMPWLFSEYIQSLGFDGLIGLEGGESRNGVTIGNHDSWVVFDPEKTQIRIIEEKPVEKCE